MKRKSLIIITVCLALTLIVAAVGVTLAWYTNTVGAGNQMQMNADGFLVVYFDDNEYDLDSIKPAVARQGAIADNVTNFDVLNADDPNIAEAATELTKESFFHYLNQSETPNSQAELAVVCEAEMVFADGTTEKLSLNYDICVAIDIVWSYNGNEPAETDKLTITGDDWKYPLKTRFTVNANADVTLNTSIYLRQVDDLCIPVLREAEKIRVNIRVAATPTDALPDPASPDQA